MARWGTVCVGAAAVALVVAVSGTVAFEQQPAPTLGAAQARLQANDAEGAAAILRELIASQPANVQAYRLLGTALRRMKKFDEALATYVKALELQPGHPSTFYNMGVLWALRGDSDKAFDFLGRAKATRIFDMSVAEGDPELVSIKSDARFKAVLPQPDDFKDPFVEPVKIVAEWVGESANDQFGWIARSIGDVDGDKIADFVTSAPTKAIGGPAAGRIYVYSTKTRALLWQADGQPNDQFGTGLEAAGDVNRDGIPDVVASAPGRGEARVLSGRDGAVLYTFTGRGASVESFGRHVAGGDVNGDGYSDVIVGAPGAAPDEPGRAVIYSGQDGAVLIELRGERAGDGFGSTVAADPRYGSALVIVGAPSAGAARTGRGYVYQGVSAKPKFVVDPDASGRALGAMFASVPGDVDGDGVVDAFVSDWADTPAGRVYVVSGKDGRRIHSWAGALAGEGLGTSASNAGDVNGDGHADFIVGAWQHASAAISGGRASLYSGKDGALLKTFTCRTPGDTFGFDAVGIGDVDGDGTVDLLITSAWSAIRGFHSGRVFIVSSGVSGGAR